MRAKLYHLSLPMQQAFGHSEVMRKKTDNALLLLKHNGLTGVGECVPRQYVTGETVESVFSVLEHLNIDDMLRRIDIDDLDTALLGLKSLEMLDELLDNNALNAICLLELALLDLLGKHFNRSTESLIRSYLLPWGLKRSSKRKETFTTSQVLDLSMSVHDFLKTRGPFHYIKVKVGNDLADSIERLNTLRAVLGWHVKLSVDANMAWSLEQALAMVQAFSPYNVDYYEEPLHKGAFAEYSELRRKTGAKIMLDESLCTVSDAYTAIRSHACDAFNIRISKCGGIVRSLRLIEIAKQHDLAYQIGAQVAESGPLVAAGRHLAAAVNHYITFEGGQIDRFFKDNYIVNPIPVIDRMTNLAYLPQGTGLGINVSPNLKRYVQKSLKWSDGKWQKTLH